MKTPANKYLISVEGEQKIGKLFVPVVKGAEENVLRPVLGKIRALPGKLTKQFEIASNSGGAMLNALMLNRSVEGLKEGDEVYISYMATDKHHFLYHDKGEDFYVVPVHHLVALKTEDGLKAVSGKVLIKPLEIKEFESELLISVNNKKNIGIGEVVSSSDGMQEKYVPGQKVVYLEKLAEWIEIEGAKYDFVYTGEVLATL